MGTHTGTSPALRRVALHCPPGPQWAGLGRERLGIAERRLPSPERTGSVWLPRQQAQPGGPGPSPPLVPGPASSPASPRLLQARPGEAAPGTAIPRLLQGPEQGCILGRRGALRERRCTAGSVVRRPVAAPGAPQTAPAALHSPDGHEPRPRPVPAAPESRPGGGAAPAAWSRAPERRARLVAARWATEPPAAGGHLRPTAPEDPGRAASALRSPAAGGSPGAGDAGGPGRGALPGRRLPRLRRLAFLQPVHPAGPVPGGHHVEAAAGAAGGPVRTPARPSSLGCLYWGLGWGLITSLRERRAGLPASRLRGVCLLTAPGRVSPGRGQLSSSCPQRGAPEARPGRALHRSWLQSPAGEC